MDASKGDAPLVDRLLTTLREGILRNWYPLVLDRARGGYFTNVTHDWELAPEQEKMIVSQARHVWTLSKVAGFFDNGEKYTNGAQHGVRFLRDVMWDSQFGGFYQIRSREGGYSGVRGWREEKRTYGNAFGLFALAAFYRLTHEAEILGFAQEVFAWIEEHAFDPKYKGYFQFLTREGVPIDASSPYKTIAADSNELGFKDQNSSIHLLEAYTELYNVWQDPAVKRQLAGLLELIRDTMVTERGYLQLFFQPDWSPVSFRDAPPQERMKNYDLDHVSFGHDCETAFLMLEASHALGIEHDRRTLSVAKKMVDHALENGWDASVGGLYDGGYYFGGENRCRITKDTKNWWSQAEALNVLLLFSHIFPDGKRYRDFFDKQWEYINRFVLDHERGDWFEGGLDKEPHFKTGPKSHMWKCTYHTGRSLMNCIALLIDENHMDVGIGERKREMHDLISHWKKEA